MTKRALFLVAIALVGWVSYAVYTGYQNSPPSMQQAGSVSPEDGEATQSESPVEGGEPATSVELAESILPAKSPAWLWIDLKQWDEHSAELREWIEEPSVQPIWSQAVAGFPNDMSATLAACANDASKARLFLMPPTSEKPASSWIAVFAQNTQPVDDAVAALMPASGTSTVIEAGPYSLTAIESETRSLVLFEDNGLLWVSNSPQTLTGLLTEPSREDTTESTHAALQQRFGDAVAILHLNSGIGQETPFANSWTSNVMRSGGLTHAAAVFHCPGNRGTVTLLAQSAEVPEWVQDWLPLEEPTFQSEDPPGMFEAGLRWLRFSQDGIISKAPVDSATAEEAFPMGRGPGLQREGRQGGRGQSGGMQRFRRGGFFSIANMIPPAQPVGINVFATINETPAVAIVLPDFALEDSFLGRMQQIPFLQPEPLELNNIPGTYYQFEGTPLQAGMGLDELVVIERDANLYLFDSRIAAEAYFEESADEVALSNAAKQRESLSNEQASAQVEGLVTTQMLDAILQAEQNRLDPTHPSYAEFTQLRESLKPRLTPMAFQGGFQNNEWIVEFDSDSEFGTMMGVLLLGWGTWSWLQP